MQKGKLTFVLGYVLNVYISLFSHISQDSENNKSWHKTCQAVHQTGYNSISVTQTKSNKIDYAKLTMGGF